MSLTAGDHVLFAKSDDVAENGDLPARDFPMAFSLNNTNEGLFLSVGGVVIDSRTYMGAAPVGKSLQRDPGDGAFCAATSAYGDGDFGTPGAVNEVCP